VRRMASSSAPRTMRENRVGASITRSISKRCPRKPTCCCCRSSSAQACCTRRCVAARTPGRWCNTRSTVARLTPACKASSFIAKSWAKVCPSVGAQMRVEMEVDLMVIRW